LTAERVDRRLAAVLAADVAGYSRLMGVDEEGTLARLKAVRKALVDPTIAKHRGRIVKTTGDGMLVEFASAVDAARGAVEVQRGMTEQNASVPHDQRIEFRIGIHLGDIIFDDNDIFGDGVNVAARLESIAEPGGICMSNDAYRQVRGKVEIACDDMGPQSLKNIAEPMQAWRVRLTAWIPSAAQAGSPSSARQSLPLPDKPSIAVVPFQNMSGDPEQEYFADGMVEDIITALSHFKSLFVIARNSSFAYKGRAIDVKQIGRELGVRYVLEGSVRKSGNRVRINGQLIEAATGAHLWAEKIDGGLEDVFELQDQVTAQVVGAIGTSITQAEIDRAQVKPTSNLDAYDCFLRALRAFYRLTREDNDVAVDYMRQAITLDPRYHLAKALLAFNYLTRWLHGWGETGDKEQGLALAREAIADDGDNPSVLRWAGHTLGFWGDYDRALAVLEKAARLNVNGSQERSSLGWVMNYACVEPDSAILHFERAIRLSPRDPEIGLVLGGIAMAHLIAGRYADSLLFSQKSVDESPRYTSSHRIKIASLVGLGRLQDARTAAAALLTIDPDFTISKRLPHYRDGSFQKRYYDGLKAAGLAE
jgi:TolB-like protein/class 3 adenylate cyclase/Tfp pilus assembly protein PilF